MKLEELLKLCSSYKKEDRKQKCIECVNIIYLLDDNKEIASQALAKLQEIEQDKSYRDIIYRIYNKMSHSKAKMRLRKLIDTENINIIVEKSFEHMTVHPGVNTLILWLNLSFLMHEVCDKEIDHINETIKQIAEYKKYVSSLGEKGIKDIINITIEYFDNVMNMDIKTNRALIMTGKKPEINIAEEINLCKIIKEKKINELLFIYLMILFISISSPFARMFLIKHIPCLRFEINGEFLFYIPLKVETIINADMAHFMMEMYGLNSAALYSEPAAPYQYIKAMIKNLENNTKIRDTYMLKLIKRALNEYKIQYHQNH